MGREFVGPLYRMREELEQMKAAFNSLPEYDRCATCDIFEVKKRFNVVYDAYMAVGEKLCDQYKVIKAIDADYEDTELSPAMKSIMQISYFVLVDYSKKSEVQLDIFKAKLEAVNI